jgi:diketogulonate reductase-like aldo/keto reductase
VWNGIPDSILKHSTKEYESLGIRSMAWLQFHELHNMAKSGKNKKERITQPYFDLFLLLWPGDWRNQLAQMNKAIAQDYAVKSKNKAGVRCIKPVSENEFFIFWYHNLVQCHW